MVLDMAKPKYKESTTWLRMRGRDAVRKSTLKVNILQVFTIDFSEIQFIVNHNSQSDGQNKKCKEWNELAKEEHTYKLTPEEKRRYKGQLCLALDKADKNGPMKLRSDYKFAVLMKNRSRHESGEPIKEVNKDEYNKDKKFSPKITSSALELTNIQDVNIGFHLQFLRGGTHLNGVGFVYS